MRPSASSASSMMGVLLGPGTKSKSFVTTVVLLTSPFSQPCDDGPCPGELLFVKPRAWRIAAIAHYFGRLIDLAERSPRHGGVLPPLGKEHQSETLIAKSPGPVERVTLGGVFLQRFAIGGDRLFELRRSALTLPETGKRIAQIALGLRPVERHSFLGLLLQRLAVGGDGLFQPCRSALALPKAPKGKPQIVLGLSPGERYSLPGLLLQRLANASYGLF